MRTHVVAFAFLIAACRGQLAEVRQLGEVVEAARASCASATKAAEVLPSPALVLEQRRRCRLSLACVEPARRAVDASVAADEAVAADASGFEERAVAKAARKAALDTCRAVGYKPRS